MIAHLADALVNRKSSFEQLKALSDDTVILKSMADEVRSLSIQSGETGRKITETTNHFTASVENTLKQATLAMEKDL